MRHPFIVDLLYAFQTGGKLYLILEYLSGKTPLLVAANFVKNKRRALKYPCVLGFHQEVKYLCSLKKKASSWRTLVGNNFWKTI